MGWFQLIFLVPLTVFILFQLYQGEVLVNLGNHRWFHELWWIERYEHPAFFWFVILLESGLAGYGWYRFRL